MNAPVSDFEAAARAKFTALEAVFGDSYWRCGHSFDTVLDYFVHVSKDRAVTFAEKALGESKPTSGLWWDDYGWWGIAGLRAAQRGDLFGQKLAAEFERIAVSCWETMARNAPSVWDRRPRPGGKDDFAPLKPRIPGGVWNSDWGAECDPRSGDHLCGIQNTVTNTLYWVLSGRLYKQFRQAKFAAAADQEYTFLREWCCVTPGQDALLARLASDQAVVRERVSTYASGKPAAGYNEKWVWAGDQGLAVGGLVERMVQLGNGHPEYPKLLETAKQVLAGAKHYLVVDGELQPWTPGETPGDVIDYSTGVAVFMRYLLYAYLSSADLRAYLLSEDSGYRSLVYENAVLHAAPRPHGGMVSLTNDLATLVAAIVMLA